MIFRPNRAEGGRHVQDSEIFKPDIHEEWVTVHGGPTGSVPVRIVKPQGTTAALPVILYTHGAGWVFGDAHTHDRLVRDLAVGATPRCLPRVRPLPRGAYPVAIEQSYAVAQWVAERSRPRTRRLADGDLRRLGRRQHGRRPHPAGQRTRRRLVRTAGAVLPGHRRGFDTGSYKEFASGYFLSLDGMKWFWDQYTTSETERAEITVSPLRATLEQLAGLPPALVINGEADVLRDEGEAYAEKLRAAGVPVTQVRYGGTIHDFVMLNSLHDTEASKAAITQAVATLKAALYTD